MTDRQTTFASEIAAGLKAGTIKTRLKCFPIPSEPRAYTVWFQWWSAERRPRDASGFLIGQVRPDGRRWRAIVDDGRGPNPSLNGRTDTFFATRRAAATWLKHLLVDGSIPTGSWMPAPPPTA